MKRLLLTLIFIFSFVSMCFANGNLNDIYTDVLREGTPLERNINIEGITCREALTEAFISMGWEHEFFLASQLSFEDPLKIVIAGLNIKPPQNVVENPYNQLTKENLYDILDWLKFARQTITWKFERVTDTDTLIISKEYVRKTNKMYEVVISSDAMSIQEIESLDFPVAIRNDEIIVGPWNTIDEAKVASDTLMSPVRQSPFETTPNPMFWIAVKTQIPPRLKFANEYSKGRLPLSFLVSPNDLFALNGGYFYMNIPVGTMVLNGVPIHQTYKNRSGIGFGNDLIFFGNVHFDMYLDSDGLNIPITRINDVPQSKKENVLFTEVNPMFAKPKINTSLLWQMQRVRIKTKTETINGIVWSQDKSIISWLKLHTNVTLKPKWTNASFNRCHTIIQAGPMIISNSGIWTDTESIDEFIRLHTQPRTLIGIDKNNNLWCIIIDGRNSNHSVGMTLSECFELGNKLELTNLLNLDGGGSSELIWRGKILNIVSEKGVERPLPYCLTF